MSWRGPKTTQEKRANQDGFCRAKRRPHKLPDAWDDCWFIEERCWKSYRKTQYKIKITKPKKDSTKYAEAIKKREHWHLDHRFCRHKRHRCKNCIKTGAWDSYDKYWKRQSKKYEKERVERDKKWRKKMGDYSYEIRYVKYIADQIIYRIY